MRAPINAADDARGWNLGHQQREAAHLLAAIARAVRIDAGRHGVPESILASVNARLDEVNHGLFAGVLEFFQTGQRDRDGRLLEREAGRRHRVVKRHVQEFVTLFDALALYPGRLHVAMQVRLSHRFRVGHSWRDYSFVTL